jgi:hypothetical protein
MEVFGFSALFGLLLGFMFGVGCASAVIYTVYLGGYRKGVEDSLSPEQSVRLSATLRKIEEKRSRHVVP